MAKEKIPPHKVVMTEGKREIVRSLLAELFASGDFNHYESGENRQNQSKRNSHYYNQTKVPKICAEPIMHRKGAYE